MKNKFEREIFYYRDYYLKFFSKLKPEVQRKFNWTLKLVATTERVPVKFFKYLKGTTGIFEIRIEVGSEIFRVLSFFDDGRLIVIMNAFQKKSQKIKTIEIELAERIRKQYFDEKKSE